MKPQRSKIDILFSVAVATKLGGPLPTGRNHYYENFGIVVVAPNLAVRAANTFQLVDDEAAHLRPLQARNIIAGVVERVAPRIQGTSFGFMAACEPDGHGAGIVHAALALGGMGMVRAGTWEEVALPAEIEALYTETPVTLDVAVGPDYDGEVLTGVPGRARVQAGPLADLLPMLRRAHGAALSVAKAARQQIAESNILLS